MKALMQIVFCLLLSSYCFANDTLTRRQIYNFNVGDTFDYKTTSVSTYQYNQHVGYGYYREIIENVSWSALLDTLFITKRLIVDNGYTELNEMVICSLDSPIDIARFSHCTANIGVVLNSVYNGRLLNRCYNSGLSCNGDSSFAEGLGLVMSNTGDSDGSGNYQNLNVELIYYNKNGEIYGAPYTLFTGFDLLHYTPIPEECATWVSDIHKLYPYPGPNAVNALVVQEKIVTGNKVVFNGHNYVELIYTGYNYLNNDNHIDSLIGYFWNDTTNKSVWFRSIDGNNTLLYDFTLLNGSVVNGYPVTLRRAALNNDSITVWDTQGGSYMEGIGGYYGFVKVKFITVPVGGANGPYADSYGVLRCFSVCGQTIYPSSDSVCPQLTSINDLTVSPYVLYISPTPASNYVSIKIDGAFNGGTLTIISLTGRIFTETLLTTSNTQLSTQNLPNGMYFVTLKSGSVISTRRLVIQK